jgi:hypothetical protein
LFAYAYENALEWAVTVWCIFRGSKVKLHFKIEHANETYERVRVRVEEKDLKESLIFEKWNSARHL